MKFMLCVQIYHREAVKITAHFQAQEVLAVRLSYSNDILAWDFFLKGNIHWTQHITMQSQFEGLTERFEFVNLVPWPPILDFLLSWFCVLIKPCLMIFSLYDKLWLNLFGDKIQFHHHGLLFSFLDTYVQ